MRKSVFLPALLGCLLLISHGPALAISIDILPQAQDVTAGTSVYADIAISGLGDILGPSISTYDMDIVFDSSILSFTNLVLGDQLDVFGFGSVSAVDSSVIGVVNLYELSLDLPSDLDAFQLPAFTIATLSFDTIGIGLSALSLTVNALGDANGDPLMANVQGASINVKSQFTTVPEPATLSLFVLGLLGLLQFKTMAKK
jgi:hypothetical protein